jgi:hypothetical protein
MRPLRFCRTRKFSKQKTFSNNPSAKNNFKLVYEIGVTVAWLWPCIFCRSIRVLRRTIVGVIHCGHYASVAQGNFHNKKHFQIIHLLKTISNLFTKPELLTPGCGRAYSVA